MLRQTSLTLACLAFVAAISAQAQAAENKLIMGVFYEGCEHTCEGFKAGIAESGIDATVVIRDIEQDKTLLPGLVVEAREMDADLVLTYGTSVTLGMLGTLDDVGDDRFLNDIPAVFTAVADPFGTGIAESFKASGRENITGTFNRVPESVNIEVIRQYDPGFGRLGLLYNSNERNSVIKFEELTELRSLEL
jgi:putative ABC transport system substrate-binding protein